MDQTATAALQQLLAADWHMHYTGRQHGISSQLLEACDWAEAALDHAIAAGVTPDQLRAALEQQ